MNTSQDLEKLCINNHFYGSQYIHPFPYLSCNVEGFSLTASQIYLDFELKPQKLKTSGLPTNSLCVHSRGVCASPHLGALFHGESNQSKYKQDMTTARLTFSDLFKTQ